MMGTNMVIVPFDLELAQKIANGEIEGRITTRVGTDVRILVFDVKREVFPVSAVVEIDNDKEAVYAYTDKGLLNNINGRTEDFDLMLQVPEYMTFKDGDIATLGWKTEDGRYCEWVTILKRVDVDSFNIITKDYVLVCLKSDTENNFSIDFDGKSDSAEWIRKSTEAERNILIDALKSSEDPRAKELLKRFFCIDNIQQDNESRKKIYISLPITGLDKDTVISKANDRKKLISFKGYEPVTPFDVSPDSNASYAEHMGRDIQALLECDAVYFCRGWQDSKGCQAEYEVAKIYGKQMVFE